VTPSSRSLLDRLLAAYPLAVAYLVLLTLYAWQTTRIPAPWIFTDELQWSLLSRGIAHTGHAQLREHATSAVSLYSYYLAPAWWAGGTAPGYTAAKYLNAVVMTASLFPAFGLGRLFLPRSAALLAAVATAAIPSLALTGVLMPESLAYFWCALALYLAARALLRPTRIAVAAAVAAVVIAPFVRGQLQVLVPAVLAAAVLVAMTSARGRATVGAWSAGERVGAVVLLGGLVIAIDVVLGHHSYEWFIGTHFWHRAFTYGLWALGAFAIGIGVLPVLFSLAWALGGPISTREDRVLLGLLTGSAVGFGAYTAVKAAYISTTFSIRVEERNVIYLSPLAFICAARWLTAGRVRAVPVALATGATGYLLWTTPYHAYDHLYSDAFGLSILQWLNQTWYWTNSDLRWLLLSILAAGVALAAVQRLGTRGAPPLRVAAIALALATIAWNLTGEISAADQAVSPAKSERSRLPTPPDWIDRVTGRDRTMFIGKALSNSEAFWSLEFWNQSIQDVWSVDASAPPPGPTTTPNFLRTDGALDPQVPVDWVVTQPEIVMRGRIVEPAGGLNLYRVPHPIRMQSFVSGVTPDGWQVDGTPSRFVRFAAVDLPGVVVVSLARKSASACGDLPASTFVIRVSTLAIDGDGQPVAHGPQHLVRRTVRSTPTCEDQTVTIRAVAPLRVDVSSTGSFDAGDGRKLTAQVGFAFKPS
jgi:hypothetical protein